MRGKRGECGDQGMSRVSCTRVSMAQSRLNVHNGISPETLLFDTGHHRKFTGGSMPKLLVQNPNGLCPLVADEAHNKVND